MKENVREAIKRLDECLFEGLCPTDWGLDRNAIKAYDLATLIAFAKEADEALGGMLWVIDHYPCDQLPIPDVPQRRARALYGEDEQ